MALDEHLNRVLQHEFTILHELRQAQLEVATALGRLQVRIADLESHADLAGTHYAEAEREGDANAEQLRDWAERHRTRIAELQESAADLRSADARLGERIKKAERDIEDFRALQPTLIAKVTAARTAGLGREVFETLADALSYIDMSLDAASATPPAGP